MMEPLYKQLFPDSQLEREKGSSTRWKTAAGGEFYAVSTQGQVTGFGAGQVDEVDEEQLSYEDLTFDKELDQILGLIGAKQNIFQGAILIDDPIKPEDAESDLIRNRINARFESTIRNRVNSRNTPIIIIMQRLHEEDLCGFLLDKEPEEWTVLSLPAIHKDADGNDVALWPMKHTLEELYKLRENEPIVFDTQYMQDPKPREGLMYSEGFHTYTYEQLPKTSQPNMPIRRLAYIDTADTGADSLCAISFLDTPEFVYILDVLYTDAPMEVTEPKTAALLNNTGVQEALIESNNGGRSFARTIKMKLRTVFKNFRIVVRSFTQTQNKKTRIFTNSAQVQNDILMPEGWEKKWPKFHSAITSYRKDNRKKSQHDDAPDALTGVYEMHAKKLVSKKIKVKNR
jgi:predicted phage terminase large subunit-like protein